MFTCKDAENACSTSNIHHYLILEKLRIFGNSFHVGLGSDCVFEHLLMDGEMWVAVKVVVFVFDVAYVGFGILILTVDCDLFWLVLHT